VVSDFGRHAAGHLRLTVAPPAAGSIVAPVLSRFLLQHPAITAEVSVDGASVDIVEGRFDAGVRRSGLVERDMIAIRIGPPVRFRVVASPQYLARKGIPQTPDDLTGHDCLRVRLPNGALLPWRFRAGDDTIDAPVSGPLVVDDRGLELRMALDGVGIVHTLSNQADAFVEQGRLVPLLQDWLPPAVDFSLFHPSRRQTPPALRALIDFLRAETWDEAMA